MDFMDEYSKIIENLPMYHQNVGGVLYSITLTVVSLQEHHHLDDYEAADDQEWYDPQSNQLINLQQMKNNTFHSIVEDFQRVSSHEDISTSLFVDADDRFSTDFFASNSLIDDHVRNEGLPSPSGLFVFMRQALVRRLYSLTLKALTSTTATDRDATIKLKHFPLEATDSINKRRLRETELLSFTSLSTKDFYQYRSLQLLHKMLQENLPSLPCYTKKSLRHDGEDGSVLRRRYSRELTYLNFLQILIEELIREPQILSQYDSWTDELLYIIYWKNLGQRMEKVRNVYYSEMVTEKVMVAAEVSSPTRQDSRPSSPELIKNKANNKTASKSKPSSAKPVKKEASAKLPADDSPNLVESYVTREKQYGIEQVVLTPAGRSLVTIKKYLSSDLAWLTIHTPSKSILGLRLSPAKVQLPKADHDSDSKPKLITDDGVFFYQSEDSIRCTITTTPAKLPILKPDGFGCIAVDMMMATGQKILTSSNGNVLLTNPAINKTNAELGILGEEVSRKIIQGGVIVKELQHGLFRQEILFPDGSRQLYRSLPTKTFNLSSIQASYRIHDAYSKYILELCVDAPIASWDSIHLTSDGQLLYIDSPSLSSSQDKPETGLSAARADDRITASDEMAGRYMKEYMDAETKAVVRSYADGRMLSIDYSYLRTTITRCHHSDGTTTLLVDSNHDDLRSKVYLIEHEHHPSIEIDLDIDSTAREHAKGLLVPINKGGNRIRARIAISDGNALMVS
jgi:hypothetical protein